MIQAIQQSAEEKECDACVFATYRSLENELAALDLAQSAGFAGIIFTLLAYPDEIIPRVGRKLPLVVIGDRGAALNADTVELNNHDAGSLIARHMAELGHRHIAYISTTLDRINTIRSQRLRGMEETFGALCPKGTVHVKSRDISPRTELDNLEIEHTVGYELARKCLSDKKITAFVAVNDMVAYGVIDAVRDAGFSVPADYSVCGFDNVFPSQFAGVSLTTIEHYIKDKGRNAFDILHAKIIGASSDRNITRVEFKHKLIVRESTAPPRAG
jgi:LacI family transcriptional regulator